MNFLKNFFPLSFKMAKSTASFIWGIVIYVLAQIVAGTIAALFSLIPVIGLLMSPITMILGSIVGLYCTAGIVILILAFAKVFKDTEVAVEVVAEEAAEEAVEEKVEE